MAEKVVKELQINVTIKNGKLVINNVDQLKRALSEVEQEQRKVAKATGDVTNKNKNATKSFADQSRSASGLVRSYAIIAANAFALSRGFEILKRSADLTIVERSAEALSRATGTNFRKVAEDMKAITGGALNIKEAFTAANLGLSGGASIAQLEQITEVATKAANVLGRSVPESVNRMIQAVIKGEPELVDEFGIILRVKEASDEYAKSIGKVASELTTLERQQAIINQLIEQGTQKFQDVAIVVNPFQKIQTSFSELIDTILQFISLPIGAVLGVLADNAVLLVAALAAIGSFLIKQLVPNITSFGDAFNKSLEGIKKNSQDTFKNVADDIDKLNKKILKQSIRQQRKASPIATTQASDSIRDIVAASGDALLQERTKGLEGVRLIENVEDIINPKALSDAEAIVDKTTGEVTGRIIKTRKGNLRLSEATTAALIAQQKKLALGVATENAKIKTSFETASLGILKFSNIATIGMLKAKNVITASAIQIVASIQSISSAETLSEAVSKFQELRESFEDIADPETFAGSALNSLLSAANIAAGGIALVANTVVRAVSFFSLWISVILITIEGLKALADFLGLIDKKAEAAEAAIETLGGSFDALKSSSAEVLASFKESSTSITDLTNKYTALNNKLGEVTKSILESTKALQQVGGRGVLRSIAGLIGPDFAISASQAEKAVDLILAQAKELEKLSGKRVPISVIVDGDVKLLESIKDNQELLDQSEIRIQIDESAKRILDQINKAALETTGRIQDIGKGAKELNNILGKELTTFRKSLPASAEVDTIESLNKSLKELIKSGRPAAEVFFTFTDSLNETSRALLGVTDKQRKQAEGSLKVLALLDKINKTDITAEGQQLELKKFLVDTKDVDALKGIRSDIEKLSKIELASDGALGVLRSLLLSDEALVSLDDIASKMANIAKGVFQGFSGGVKDLDKSLDDLLNTTKAVEKAQATAAIRGVVVAKQLDIARIQQAKGLEGSTQRVFALEREALQVSIAKLSAERLQLQTRIKAENLQPSTVRNLKDSLALKNAELNLQIQLAAVKQGEFSKEKAVLLERKAQLEIQAKQQQATDVEREGRLKRLQTIEQDTFRSLSERNTALESRLPLEQEVLDAKVKQTESSIKIAEVEKDIAEESNNASKAANASLKIAREQVKLSEAQQQAESLVTKQILDRLSLKKEELEGEKRELDLLTRRKDILLSIAGNEEVSASFRSKALEKGITLQREEVANALILADSNIAIAQSLRDTLAARGESAELDAAQEAVTVAILEKGELLNAQLDSQLEKRKQINELQKKLVDRGNGDFDKALAESLSIASIEFSRGLVDSVTIATNTILSTIDTAVDSLLDNLDKFLSGDTSGKEALSNLINSISDTVNKALQEQFRDQLKAFIKTSLFGDSDEDKPISRNQGKDVISLLESISANTAEPLGKTGALASSGTGAAGLLGGFSSAFGSLKSIGSSIGDLFSNAGFEPEVKLASGGIVTRPTNALIGEAGPEAVIPLNQGSLPVQISETTSVAAVKALVTVGDQIQKQVETSDSILSQLKTIDTTLTEGFTNLTNLISTGTSAGRTSVAADEPNKALSFAIAAIGVISSVIGAFGGSAAGAGASSATTGAGSSAVGGLSGASQGGFAFAKGGVIGNGIRALANGGVTTSPEIGIIGEGENNEAVVPLPDNRNIPVVLMNEDGEPAGTAGGSPTVNITMNFSGNASGNQPFNKSANQIALETARVVQRSLRRDD